tara:strand:- start:5787 stop:9338 length:3552 start_codon:yes stop_codon:yes gene_type:complete
MAQYSPNFEFQIFNTDTKERFDLDVEKITDYPLALTYSIKDVQDPSSSKGSYSKTFIIPATGHNNTTLKGLFSESLFDSHLYVEDYDAFIFIDGMSVLAGKFQIKGTKYKGVPQSYSCQVYGENYKWVNALSELNLCDIDFTAGNFFPLAPTIATFERDDIMATWEFGQAGDIQGGVQTHFIYPLVNTGKWNFEDVSTGEGIPTPSDMSPAFYFYNMLKCMFAKQGYTLQSTFFETSWFKRLVSFIPMESFVNNPTIIIQYSFEYDTSVSTPWKTPLDYYHQTGADLTCLSTGNDWHGQSYGLTLSCPTCDPSGQVTDQDITPFINSTSPLNVDTQPYDEPIWLAGWYWGNYSYNLNSGGFQSHNTPWAWLDNPCLMASPTNISEAYPFRTLGHDWFCVDCEPWFYNPAIGLPFPSPYLDKKEIEWKDTSMFQSSYLGIYEFSGSMTLKMDNDYEIDNDVATYDPWPTFPTSGTTPDVHGTTNGGVDYLPHFNVTGTDFYTGTAYDFTLYLMHYKHATRSTHTVHVESFRRKNSNNPMASDSPPLQNNFALFNDTYPLTTSVSNLSKKLSFSGIQIDILDPEDRVFLYGEVNSVGITANNISGESVFQVCQMKYRASAQEFSGTIDPQIIAGGSVDLELLLPCDTSQLSWVNGLTGLFNLFWQSDEATKTIIVEPRDTFFNGIYDAEGAIDWTAKLDHGEPQINNYIYDSLKRNLCFTYENDSADVFVEERNRRRGQICELGSHALNLGELYLNDDQKIGSDYYSPTYMFADKTCSNNMGVNTQPFIPVIHAEYSSIWATELNADLPDKLTEFAPRMLIWYGKQPINQADGLNSANTWRWGYDDLTSPHDNLEYYPFAGVYSDQDGTLAGSLILGATTYDAPSLYFEESAINAVSTPAPYDQTNGLYQMFWEYHILSLLNRPVVKVAFFKLTPKDIANLNYRRLIYLQSAQADTYWILNKIIDYKGGKNEMTKVELFEFTNTRPVKTLSLSNSFGANLTPQWTDFSSQLVKDGAILVEQKYLTSSLQIANQTFINKPTNQVQKSIATGTQLGVSALNSIYTSDGTKIPTQLGVTSGNIGNNYNVGVGGISIGNNIRSTSGNITIGNGNNPFSQNPIQLTQNGKTALAISTGGLMLEGGGGVVYYENTAGEIMEVMTGIPYHSMSGLGTPAFQYVRCLLSEPIF